MSISTTERPAVMPIASGSPTGTADDVEISILMPCLNEAESVELCIRKAQSWIQRSGVRGEIVIADNGSNDGSQALSETAGARVVSVEEKGYGSALRGGIAACRGRYVVMGDADDSYDFSELDGFLWELRAGNQLVMGNRFKGGIREGAMPALHRYLGNPVLSFIGRLFFHTPIGDFHCGLRGFDRQAIESIGLATSGMEFASEMVVRASLAGLSMTEVPIVLHPDKRTRKPHLRTWRDGWRHLRFLLLLCPTWLFLVPGLAAFLGGLIATVALTVGPVKLGGAVFDVGSLVYATCLTLMGHLCVMFCWVARSFGEEAGLLPPNARTARFRRAFRLERGLLWGTAIFAAGVVAALFSLLRWRSQGFGELDYGQQIRVAAPAALGMTLGFSTIMTSFLLAVFELASRRPRR